MVRARNGKKGPAPSPKKTPAGQTPPETAAPASPLSYSALLAGCVIGLLAVYLVLTFVYVKDQQPSSPNGTSNLSVSKPAPDGTVLEKPDSRQAEDARLPINHSFTFEEVFEQLRAIDQKHKTDFRKENLRKQILPPTRIAQALKEVKALQDELNRSIITNETIFWLHLVEGRINQLESERHLQIAMAYGNRGFFSRNITESCQRHQDILEATLLLNQSARFGGMAMYHFDETLTQEKTWPILGINDKRMAFYGGDTRDIGALANTNMQKVRTKCLGLPPDEPPRVMKSLEQAAGNGTILK